MRRKITRSGNATHLWGGVFLISCKNASDSGGGGGGGGSGSDSRGLSSSNILGKTDVTITNTEKLKAVLERANFVDSSGNFTGTIPNPDTTGKKTEFEGLLLINHPNGTTEYVDVNNNTLVGNPDIEDGVQVVAVFKEPGKTIKKIKIEVEAGKQVIVPVAVSNGDPNLQEIQDALNEYGIKLDLNVTSANSPKGPGAPYTYRGVAKGNGTTPITNETISENDTLKPLFQKDVTFTVKINGTTVGTAMYVVTHPATVATKKLSEVFADPNVNITASPTAPTGKKFDSWKVGGGQGSIKHADISSKDVTSENDTVIEAYFVELGKASKNFTIQMPNSAGNGFDNFTVPVVIGENDNSTTWDKIVEAAKTLTPPVDLNNPTTPAGYTFTEWQKGGTKIESGTTISTGDNNIQPVFKKTLSYKVYFGKQGNNLKESKFVVTYPETRVNKTLNQIFTGTGETSFVKKDVTAYISQIFTGWRVLTTTDAPNSNGTFFTADTIASNTNTYASDKIVCFYADYSAFKDKIGGIDDMSVTAVAGGTDPNTMTTIADMF